MRPMMNCSQLWMALPWALMLVQAQGCLGTEEREKPAARRPDVPTEGKPKAPSVDVVAAASPGPTPGAFHLTLDTLVKQDGQSFTAEYRLPAGVTAADPAQLKARRGAVPAGTKQTFPLDVTVDQAALVTGTDVMCVVTVGFGGVNRDTVTRLVRLGTPAANVQAQPTATGQDGTGKPIRENRAGH